MSEVGEEENSLLGVRKYNTSIPATAKKCNVFNETNATKCGVQNYSQLIKAFIIILYNDSPGMTTFCSKKCKIAVVIGSCNDCVPHDDLSEVSSNHSEPLVSQTKACFAMLKICCRSLSSIRTEQAR